MSANVSNHSASNDRASAINSETKLFGEVPLSDSDNISTVLRLSKSSIMSDDGDNIQVSDLDEEKNDDGGNFVKEKNNLNALKSKDQIITNGTTISPYYTNINNNAIETIAVIDIDGDGEYTFQCPIPYMDICLR